MIQTQSSREAIDKDYLLFKRILFILALLLVVVATILAITNNEISILYIVYGAAALCLLFVFLPYFKNISIFGMKAELQEVKEAQNAQAVDIELVQRVSFSGIVSKYEIKHLFGLATNEGGYELRYSQDLRNELKRLDDFGFIFPNEGMGLNSIDQKYGIDINKYEAKEKTPFNLKDFYHITEYGVNYIELAKKIGLPERP